MKFLRIIHDPSSMYVALIIDRFSIKDFTCLILLSLFITINILPLLIINNQLKMTAGFVETCL